jgi:regulator of protease activity HflC (stomatin/prohibitin superfamily)
MISERVIQPMSGWFPLVVCLTGLIGSPLILLLSAALASETAVALLALALVPVILASFIMLFGFQAIAPNQARVMLLFGEYKGTVTQPGFYWVNPFYSKKKLSLRIRNFETGSIVTPERRDPAGKIVQEKSRTLSRPSKVNDRDGNPIEISAVVVWRVVNTAEALFEVDDYDDFVAVQSEAALRSLASRHP